LYDLSSWRKRERERERERERQLHPHPHTHTHTDSHTNISTTQIFSFQSIIPNKNTDTFPFSFQSTILILRC